MFGTGGNIPPRRVGARSGTVTLTPTVAAARGVAALRLDVGVLEAVEAEAVKLGWHWFRVARGDRRLPQRRLRTWKKPSASGTPSSLSGWEALEPDDVRCTGEAPGGMYVRRAAAMKPIS